MAFRQALARSSQMVSGTLGNLLFQLIRNKLIALALGPAGVGWIALVNNLVETTATVTGGGVSDALNRELARKRPAYTQGQIVSTTLGISLLLMALALPAVAVALAWIVPQRLDFAVLALGVTVAIAGATGWRIIAGLFLGLGLARTMALATLAGAAANLALTAMLLSLGVTEPLIFVMLSPLCVIICGLIAARSRLAGLIESAAIRVMPAKGPVMIIALPVSIGLLLDPLIALYLRSVVGLQLGEVAIGLLQPGFLFVLLAASIFNTVAGITVVRWDQSEERAFSRDYALLLLAAFLLPIVGIGLIWLLQPIYPLLISLLFADEFRSGAIAVPWLLAGEALRMGGALFLFTFLSRQLGYLTILPRVLGLATAIAMIEMSPQLTIEVAARSYAAAFAANFALSLILWLGLQLRLYGNGGTN
ncbi:MATE family efflux transporter [Aurantiacibacter sediminis]|uniref:Polysaccharide biosynthesis protein n=1 Tax=Aurantiacibacter sediminis TaxID=2793064 RepID=A0ABS0MZW4_9SPHN|nr:hypothetical protein [Aurantiacibacter sediminis]MBH5321247.1 hypothetical protein [Aurantiacibacter sediminis]